MGSSSNHRLATAFSTTTFSDRTLITRLSRWTTAARRTHGTPRIRKAGTSGPTGSGSSTSCVYPREGIYNVSLTVIDDVGLQSVFTDPINVTAPITNPNPRVTMSAPYGFVGEPVTFDGSGSTDPYGWIVRWVWDFGDGNQSEAEVVSHSFTEARTYYVTLTVFNDRGSAGAVAEPVTVYALPPFEIYRNAAG